MSGLIALMMVLNCCGCTLTSQIARDAIPVTRLPEEWKAPCKEDMQPIDFSLLANPGQREHLLGPGDVVGIHIEGVLSEPKEVPYLHYPENVTQNLNVPIIGVPFRIDPDGMVRLPRLNQPVPLAGLTISQANHMLTETYTRQTDILKENAAIIRLELIQPYSPRVVVIRGDRPGDFPLVTAKENQVVSQHGAGEELLLRRPENDVLHALAATGGLPGTDADDAVWVLRSQCDPGERLAEIAAQIPNIINTEVNAPYRGQSYRVIRIPMRVSPLQPLPFRAEDVTLHDGDVVYVPPRRPAHFIVGGLVDGGRYPLPRDEDIDVIDALAMSNGPTAGTGPQTLNLRGGPGNIVDPSRVIVIRTLPSGDKVKIHVDLARAHSDSSQELLIQPDDIVVLQYKEHELAANVLLNLFTFSFSLNKSIN